MSLFLQNVVLEPGDVDAGGAVVQDIRSETFGQRHFTLVAPGGVLVDVIQPIPFTGE